MSMHARHSHRHAAQRDRATGLRQERDPGLLAGASDRTAAAWAGGRQVGAFAFDVVDVLLRQVAGSLQAIELALHESPLGTAPREAVLALDQRAKDRLQLGVLIAAAR